MTLLNDMKNLSQKMADVLNNDNGYITHQNHATMVVNTALHKSYQAKIEKLEAENKILRECLEWYGSKNHIDVNWCEPDFTEKNHAEWNVGAQTLYIENGAKARDVLEKLK